MLLRESAASPEVDYNMTASPSPKDGDREAEAEQIHSGDEDGPMNPPRTGIHGQHLLPYEFEVKEQDRWLPIANGQFPPPPFLVSLLDHRLRSGSSFVHFSSGLGIAMKRIGLASFPPPLSPLSPPRSPCLVRVRPQTRACGSIVLKPSWLRWPAGKSANHVACMAQLVVAIVVIIVARCASER